LARAGAFRPFLFSGIGSFLYGFSKRRESEFPRLKCGNVRLIDSHQQARRELGMRVGLE
jgi:hypothetical protein